MSDATSRERYNGGIDSLAAACGPFVTTSSFLKGGVNRVTTDVVVANKGLILALRSVHDRLTFRVSDLKKMLAQHVQSSWKMDARERQKWLCTMSKRIASMCRRVNQASIKKPKWWKTHFSDSTPQLHAHFDRSRPMSIDGEPLVGQGEDGEEEEYKEEEEEVSDVPVETPPAVDADPGLYGWCRDAKNAYRWTGDAAARDWAIEIKVPENAHPSDSVVAVFQVGHTKIEKHIADVTVEEYNLGVAVKMRVRGATKFADVDQSGEPIYVSVKQDRGELVVIEGRGEKKRKQHDQVVVSKFPNIESAIALMTGLAMDLCSNKLKLEDLKDERKKRARDLMIKKRPAAAMDANEQPSVNKLACSNVTASPVAAAHVQDNATPSVQLKPASSCIPRSMAQDEHDDSDSVCLIPSMHVLNERHKYEVGSDSSSP